jgi:hypothetical protein
MSWTSGAQARIALENPGPASLVPNPRPVSGLWGDAAGLLTDAICPGTVAADLAACSALWPFEGPPPGCRASSFSSPGSPITRTSASMP